MANVTNRSSLTARTVGQVTGSTPDATSAMYQAARNSVPFYVENWLPGSNGIGVVAGDTDNEWLDVTGNTFVCFQLGNVGAFSGSFQASIDGGANFVAIVPEVGSTGVANPISAGGIYKFRGVFEFIRYHTTSVTTSITVSASAVAGS